MQLVDLKARLAPGTEDRENREIEAAKKEQEDIAKLMPSREVLLRFENVDKFVELVEERPFRKKKITLKQILFGVSGCVRPGEVMALMGPSGKVFFQKKKKVRKNETGFFFFFLLRKVLARPLC